MTDFPTMWLITYLKQSEDDEPLPVAICPTEDEARLIAEELPHPTTIEALPLLTGGSPVYVVLNIMGHPRGWVHETCWAQFDRPRPVEVAHIGAFGTVCVTGSDHDAVRAAFAAEIAKAKEEA